MSKPFTITDWTVETVEETKTVGAKGFQKRKLVITDNGDKYPQYRIIEAVQDKCADFDGFAKGDKVKVDFWAGGRKWKSPQGEIKYFNTDMLASIEKIGHDWDASTATHEQQVVSALDKIMPPEDTDLPF